MLFKDNGLRHEFYPQDPSAEEAAMIREALARQWACIMAGEQWGDDLPEAIRAVRYGPLAWAMIPPTAMRVLNGQESWLTPWVRSDGTYQTLSPLGREKLGVRPVGLTMRRRWDAARAGLTDALCQAHSGDPAFMRPGWTPTVYAGEPMPLYRWRSDWEDSPHVRQQWASLEHPERIAAEDPSKVFTRPRKPDPIESAMVRAVSEIG